MEPMATMREVKNKINEDYLQRWQEEWDNETSCRQTRRLIPTVDTCVDTVNTSTRQQLKALVALITGFGAFNYHLHNTGAADSNLCRFCESETEEAFHLLMECPRFEMHRREIDAEMDIDTTTLKSTQTFIKKMLRNERLAELVLLTITTTPTGPLAQQPAGDQMRAM